MAQQSAFEPAPTLIRKYGKGGRLELSVGFFQRLFEAGLDQPIKETPILQVLRSSDKKRDQFSLRAKLSDGIFDYTACFFDKKVMVQNDRDKFAEKVQKVGNTWIGGEIIAVTAGRWCSEVMLADQKYAFIVESYDLLARNLPELMPEGMTETKHHDGNPESFKGFKPQSSIGIPWGGSESGDMGEPAAKRTKPLSEQTNRIVPPMSTSVSGGGPLAGLASVTPIKSLSPYLQRWKIHGLVTNREELRAIKSKAGKDLRIFSFEIADKNGDKIRITGFDAEADKASTQIQQGQTYFIANGAVKTANKQWNYTGCDYEITLNRTSEITPSYDDKIEKPAFRLRICPLKDIPAHNGETVDVLVIVTEVGEAVNFTSRTNKDLTKRDLTVVDKSGTETQIILWGDVAKGFDPEAKGQVVGFKGYAVKEYQGGYSLSSGFSASEYVLTPSLPEVAELYEWKDGEMGTTTFQKITVTGGSNLLTNQRPLRLMQSLRLGDNASGAAEFVTIHADIVRIKPENSLYKACPSPDCKKKVVDVDGSYRCEKCGHTTQNFKWLYLLQSEISDGTASVYATIFSPVADQIIGKSADELGNIMEADHNEFMQILSDAYLKPYTFRIKAKSEFYNDENRMKYVVMKAANRDYATYNQLLLNTIAKLDAITV